MSGLILINKWDLSLGLIGTHHGEMAEMSRLRLVP